MSDTNQINNFDHTVVKSQNSSKQWSDFYFDKGGTDDDSSCVSSASEDWTKSEDPSLYSNRNVNENGISPPENSVSSAENTEQETAIVNEYKACIAFKSKFTQHWIQFKDNINVATVTEKLRGKGLIKDSEFTNVQNNPREIEAERLLNHLMKKIENSKDIALLEEILDGDEMMYVLHNGRKSSESQKSHRDHKAVLEKTKYTFQEISERLMNILTPNQVIRIKDHLLQCKIIDLDENEQLCNNVALLDMRNKEPARRVLQKAIEKVHLGSYDCILECLCEINEIQKSGRLTSLLNDLKSSRQHKMLEKKKPIEATLREVRVRNAEQAPFNVKMEISFKEDNEETRKVYEILAAGSTEDITLKLGGQLGVACTKMELGSLVIHLKSLDGLLLSRLNRCIHNKDIERIIELLFDNSKVKKVLTAGKHKLELKIGALESQETVKQSRKSTKQKFDMLSCNRSFLIREMDTTLILKACEEKKIPVNMNGINVNDRYQTANRIIDEIIKNKRQKTFRKIIEKKNLTYIHQRLITFNRVYSSETKYLRNSILANFWSLITNVDVDEIRETYVERNVVEETFFDELEDKFGSDRKRAMLIFLMEILTPGSDAKILTLIDALFIIELEWLANQLLYAPAPKVSFVQNNEDPKDFSIIIRNENDEVDKDILIHADFELILNTTGGTKRPRSAPLVTERVQKRLRRVSSVPSNSCSASTSLSKTICHEDCLQTAPSVSVATVANISATTFYGDKTKAVAFLQLPTTTYTCHSYDEAMETDNEQLSGKQMFYPQWSNCRFEKDDSINRSGLFVSSPSSTLSSSSNEDNENDKMGPVSLDDISIDGLIPYLPGYQNETLPWSSSNSSSGHNSFTNSSSCYQGNLHYRISDNSDDYIECTHLRNSRTLKPKGQNRRKCLLKTGNN